MNSAVDATAANSDVPAVLQFLSGWIERTNGAIRPTGRIRELILSASSRQKSAMASRAVDIQQVQRHGPAQQSGTVGSVRGQLAGPQEAADDLPRCHVTRLDMAGGKIVGVFVNQPPGYVALPPNGRVVVAAATVESTRLALLSFRGMPGYERIGRNL